MGIREEIDRNFGFTIARDIDDKIAAAEAAANVFAAARDSVPAHEGAIESRVAAIDAAVEIAKEGAELPHIRGAIELRYGPAVAEAVNAEISAAEDAAAARQAADDVHNAAGDAADDAWRTAWAAKIDAEAANKAVWEAAKKKTTDHINGRQAISDNQFHKLYEEAKDD
jgi:hypothetical protein